MGNSGTSLPHRALGRPASTGDLLLRRRYRLVADRLPPASAGRAESGRRRPLLVDIGCGNGAQTALFAPRFAGTIGVDVARGHVPEFQAAIPPPVPAVAVVYDGDRLPLPDGAADVVTCFAVLEHVASEEGTLAEIARVLRPEGTLLISVPHRWWIFETHGADLPLLSWNRVPLVSWWPRRLHDRYARARIYRRRDIVARLRASGFAIEVVEMLTAPLDVLRWRPLRDLLRATIVRADRTALPVLAVEVLVVARRV